VLHNTDHTVMTLVLCIAAWYDIQRFHHPITVPGEYCSLWNDWKPFQCQHSTWILYWVHAPFTVSEPERTTCKLECKQPNLDLGYSAAFHWHVCVHVRWNAC